MAHVSEKVEFKNAKGDKLAARLERPQGKITSYALFAHCFSCSKDIAAASRIARALTQFGVAVLRFDFTGLGNSDGDFANTNFSSNVADLHSAADFLRQEYGPPSLLIGHSLGGAAVLAAAGDIPEVKAVCTIGAPSDVSHVAHLFDENKAEIESSGEATVNLAGRKFKIKKQFLDDVKNFDLEQKVKSLRPALLIMHSPQDNTVSIDHAKKLYSEAKHPKSFVSLDGADHLLMKKEDSEYAARVMAAWATRYLDTNTEAVYRPSQTLAEGDVLVQSRDKKFTQDIYTDRHYVVADEPPSVGGKDLGLNPYELLLAGLGACTSMTLQMYAERKSWPLERVEVLLSNKKIHANDCSDCETQKGMVDEIYKRIRLHGPLDDEQKARLMEIAEKCPVNRSLQSEVKVRADILS